MQECVQLKKTRTYFQQGHNWGTTEGIISKIELDLCIVIKNIV